MERRFNNFIPILKLLFTEFVLMVKNGEHIKIAGTPSAPWIQYGIQAHKTACDALKVKESR